MKINEHYGIVRPLNYDDSIAAGWGLWANNQMGILDLPMFRILIPKLLEHAERCINKVNKKESGTLGFHLIPDSGMLRIEFIDENRVPALLGSHLKYSEFPKFTPVTIRRLIEMIYRDCDESIIHTKEFHNFTEMMRQDLTVPQLKTLTNAFPWLELANRHFEEYQPS